MQMATGAQYQMNSSGMQPSAMQQPGMQHAQDRSGTVGGAPNAMYPRNGGVVSLPCCCDLLRRSLMWTARMREHWNEITARTGLPIHFTGVESEC